MSLVLNDLYDYNLKIYQDASKFKFSLDSLLLSEFVEINKKSKTLLDLCTGNAPLPLIIASKSKLQITGIEIQPEIYNLALKSIAYNNLTKKINILNINAIDTPNYFPGNNFDIITCNPPFFKYQPNSLINENKEKAIARHEITITLKSIIEVTSKLLKDKGEFYLVHRPERLEEMLILTHKHNLIVKKIEFIYTNTKKNAIMVLLKFVKNGKLGTKIYSTYISNDIKTYQNIFKKEEQNETNRRIRKS